MQQPINCPQPALPRLAAILRSGRKPGAQLGFTLVVLLIAGMVSGLLFEGAAQLMGMQARL
jgi:hypothetical protein